MKTLVLLAAMLASLPSFAASRGGRSPASAGVNIAKLKKIVCESVAYYEEEKPGEKEAARGVKIFTRAPKLDKGGEIGFTLVEYGNNDEGGLSSTGNQQYSFRAPKDGVVTFEFFAAWKASGELKLLADGAAKGFINQKTHITDLNCFLSME